MIARLEALERRRLLSAALGADGVLRVTGTEGPDAIKLFQPDAAHYMLIVNDEPPQTYDAASVRRAFVRGLGGDDDLRVGIQAGGAPNLPATLDGGAGKDLLRTDGGTDVLVGGDGDDYLFSGPGNDRMYAGAGRDIILAGPGTDVVWAGDGDDFVNTGYPDTRLTAYGGDGNDFINGGPNRDVIFGGPGNDVLAAHGGANLVVGGSGRDMLTIAGPGSALFGGKGVDELDGFWRDPADLRQVRDYEPGVDIILGPVILL